MISAKKGGLSVSVSVTKKVADVAVGLCFKLPCDGCVANRLKGVASCGCDSFPEGSEETALGLSLFLAVKAKLCGSPKDLFKTKVGNVTCVMHSDHFGINWKTQGTVSAVRKSLGIALSVLNPANVFSTWSRCIKQMGGSADKESFLYVASKAAAAIKSELNVLVVGKINIDQKKLDEMMKVLEKKHDVDSVAGGKKPSGHTKCNHDDQTELKVSGWGSAVLSDYIQFKVKGLVPQLCNKYLLLNIKPAQWATAAKKIKEGIKDFVDAKYMGVGDELPAIFGYLALCNSTLCACDVSSAISSKMSAESVKAAISKGL